MDKIQCCPTKSSLLPHCCQLFATSLFLQTISKINSQIMLIQQQLMQTLMRQLVQRVIMASWSCWWSHYNLVWWTFAGQRTKLIKVGSVGGLKKRQDIRSILGNIDVLSLASLAGFVTVGQSRTSMPPKKYFLLEMISLGWFQPFLHPTSDQRRLSDVQQGILFLKTSPYHR